MNEMNDDVHIKGNVYKKSLMTDDQRDLQERIARLLQGAKEKAIEADDMEAAAKYYIQKLESDLQANYRNNSTTSDQDIIFLTMR